MDKERDKIREILKKRKSEKTYDVVSVYPNNSVKEVFRWNKSFKLARFLLNVLRTSPTHKNVNLKLRNNKTLQIISVPKLKVRKK